jgi:hypothetical protein
MVALLRDVLTVQNSDFLLCTESCFSLKSWLLTIYSKSGRNKAISAHISSINGTTCELCLSESIVVLLLWHHQIIFSNLFLCILQKIPKGWTAGAWAWDLEVSEQDSSLFQILKRKQEDIVKAVKAYNKYKKSSETGDLDGCWRQWRDIATFKW